MNYLPRSNNILLLLSSHLLLTAVTSIEGSLFFYQRPEYPRDCKEVYTHCSSDNFSGVHTIKPDGYPHPFEVYCDNQMASDGWTVIQRRIDGSVTFRRDWDDYRKGFGFSSTEFYIGNEKLSYLANQDGYELRIDMVLSNGSHFYVKYPSFRISDAWGQYAVVVAEGFSGNSSCVATSCPPEMVHGSCTCQTSCRGPTKTTDCSEVCVETCMPKRCYVIETDSYILEGQFYTDAGCTKNCSCAGGQLICVNYGCDINAVCENESGSYQCLCNEGFSGDGEICRPLCLEPEVYGTCTCQKSCANPTGCVSCHQGENCFCPDGFYLQGEHCVRQEDCGCLIDGNIISNGGTYFNANCSRRCTCDNNQLNCTNNECSPNAPCTVKNGKRKCYCTTGQGSDDEGCPAPVFTDCNDVQNARHTQSGVYSIRPTGWSGLSFDVFCNMTIDGGGWTVIQRRKNGATNFYRNWTSYKNGFGDIQNDFWLGNEKLHYITQQADYEVRVDYVSSSYNSYYNKYTRFRIGNEASSYTVTNHGSFSGTGKNSLNRIKNIAFSTYDQDNDGESVDCAEEHQSGWWHGGYKYYAPFQYCYYFPEGGGYGGCSYGNLNGNYNGSKGNNIFAYFSYYRSHCYIKYTEIKIRRTSLK